ncbi:hypothetical protein [Novosphingobium sp. NDB2Meth1]|uniref:hypothetical protein n=1 Tax=Novosphingobium sp. NDB2Meth1 TaxID=1892847 RepID=UPI001160A347|nr:hypothetical protein [Novosphingobium sp. NDB2Meth1]
MKTGCCGESMPVESKMAVGFWQMQTFEMAVRKGGFVPTTVIPLDFLRPSSIVVRTKLAAPSVTTALTG